MKVPPPEVFVALDNMETPTEPAHDAKTENIKVTKERPNVFLVKMDTFQTKATTVVSNPII